MTDSSLWNILLLGFAFFCSCTAYVSTFNAQKYILETIKNEDSNYHADAYTALCITFGSIAIFNWMSPSVINFIGARATLFLGATLNIFYIAQFLYPIGWLLYLSSVISGIAGALSWAAQGTFLTVNSNKKTIRRNSALLWVIIQSGCILGNIYILCTIREHTVTKSNRTMLFAFMTSLCCISSLTMIFLRKPKMDAEIRISPMEAFIKIIKLFLTRDMILLSITFFYCGLELSFFSGIYSNSIGFTKKFKQNDITLISISGILLGLGEVVAGSLFGAAGHTAIKNRHYPVVIIGFCVHILTFITIFINLPNSSTDGPTYDNAYVNSSVILALFGSFCLGFADACYITQIYAILGSIYAEKSASAFAIFKFMQDGACAIAFFYAPIKLYAILIVLTVFAILGTISFCIVDLKPKHSLQNENNNLAI